MKKRPVRLALMVLAAVSVLALASGAAVAEDAVRIEAEMERIIVGVGKTVRIQTEVTPSAARKAGVVYHSSDEQTATVDWRGNLKGIAAGECEVTVTSKQDEGVALTLPVSVVIPVKKVTAEAAETTIHVGETTGVTCQYAPENATLKQATFSSSRESVATVNENGVVIGISRGQTDITVKSADGAAKARVRINVLQQPTGVSVSPEELVLPVGKRGTLKATVLPKNADNKAVTWSSSDEAVATVDKRGRVTSVSRGQATITATCVDDPSISASVIVNDVQLAKSVSFGSKQYGVIIGQTLQLAVNVGPEDASDKSVTYKVKNPKIATVDENGVVTGLKGGKTTVTATTKDGSKRRATTTVEVLVPVTGVHFEHKDARIGANAHGYVTAVIEPEDASNKRMTWVSSDESIATVKGDHNKVRISGRRWGRCQVTGTTADGGYTCTLDVNIGSLRHAVSVNSIEIKDGKPYIVLQNKSDMNITSVSFEITGTDEQKNPVRMSTKDNTLYGAYELPLEPGAKTRHGNFTFYHHSNYPKLEYISIAITGWETDTGYYNRDGGLEYSYSIPEKSREWVSWASDLYKQIQNNPRAN